jgi:hypothetical protein
MTVNEICKLIKTAKEKQDRATEATSEVINALQELIPNASSIPTKSENADTLEEAVLCYIQYGEFGLENLKREFFSQMDMDNQDL